MHLNTDPADHFAPAGSDAIPIRLLTQAELKADDNGLSQRAATWAKSTGFEAKTSQHCTISDENGNLEEVLFGLGSGEGEGKAFAHAKLARTLPKGDYKIAGSDVDETTAALAWAMGGYSFDRYRKRGHQTPKLSVNDQAKPSHLTEAVFFARDLINTPANDMGPDALEEAFHFLAKTHEAKVSVIKGDDLLKQNFPMVHAVGRASAQAPRVLDMTWGKSLHPKITLVGKGVTFDTGGLNIKLVAQCR